MSTNTVIEEAPAPEVVSETQTNEEKANKLVLRYSAWSMGCGLIPVIALDLAAVVAVQIKMLSEMSKIYGVEFKENRAKSIVFSLVASLGIVPITTGLVFCALKVVPGLGHWAARIALPLTAGAVTYATGKVFIKHFESGGDFLNLNTAKMKDAYRKAFEQGKAVLKKVVPSTAPAPDAAAAQ